MNTPQTRFIALSAKKATNTEHTVINGNRSKCRISPFWVAQAKKCILCTMYVRKKHNRSGSTSVVVVSKASGKYKEIKSGSSEIWSDA